ncbi:MAG TPA: transglycosylase SLT domain-containing protein [Polyangiaceae bacterium]
MRYARTAALVTSVFSAGITLGYGAVPTQFTRALVGRAMVPAAQPAAAAPGGGGSDPSGAVAANARDQGMESSELRVLRSPEFERFGEPSTAQRPQTSHPASVCGTGVERRLCNGSDDADPEAVAGNDANWMVGLRAPDIPVHASVRVERFFRYLTESTSGRKLFKNWLKRSGRYHDVVANALHERGLPQDLEAVAFVESGYSPTAVSSEGATGMWQFMAGTAHVYGLAVDDDFDERRNVQKSTDAATKYLSDLYERFGSWELAMAAYDMGYGRLTKRVQELSTNDYWTLSLVRGAIPDEALAYVPKVIAVAILLRNLDRFGFDEVQQDPPLLSSELEVPGGTPLRLVARAAGTSLERLHVLNPELLTAYVPDRGSDLTLRVPSRGVARANTMLPRLLSHWHPGAEERVDDGFDWGSDDASGGPSRRARASSFWSDPLGSGAPRASAEMQDPEGGDRDPGADATDGETALVFYRVEDGESVQSIARRFGVKPTRIVVDNRLDPAAKLQKGMLLKLRVPRGSLSRLASERPLDDSQYAPAMPIEAGATADEPPTVGSPAPAASPEPRTRREENDPFAPRTPQIAPRTKRSHGARSSGNRSMADFADLFARKP